MMDFTIKKYTELLEAIVAAGYSFQTMAEFISNPKSRVFVLRHDVDERPQNALRLAKVESSFDIKATYYFRIVKISNDSKIIKEIIDMGHEIGYHYEDYAACNGDLDAAITSFKNNLKYFCTYYPVKTVCMHGSSMSIHDNRDLWKYYSLADFGIIGEPYLSIDYSNVLYLTDTARTWDGDRYSIRDAVVTNSKSLTFHSTSDIIKALENNDLPARVILQSHTLWTDSVTEWIWLELRELLRNNLKIIINKSPSLRKYSYRIIQGYSNRERFYIHKQS